MYLLIHICRHAINIQGLTDDDDDETLPFLRTRILFKAKLYILYRYILTKDIFNYKSFLKIQKEKKKKVEAYRDVEFPFWENKYPVQGDNFSHSKDKVL